MNNWHLHRQDTDVITEIKKQLRKQYLRERVKLSPQEWRSKSEQICHNILDSDIFREAKVILSYLSYKQEPDLRLLHEQNNFIWGLPRCQNQNLIWHQWQWGDTLSQGKYGIFEPCINSPLIDLSLVDLILVPAVMIDRHGYRLGYGGGYYDRMLAVLPSSHTKTMGIIFDFAYVESLPLESWDQPLQYICTPSLGVKKVED